MSRYNETDFTGLDAIVIGATGATGEVTTITDLTWHGYPFYEDLGETAMLYKGGATATGKGAQLAWFYTAHVGGDWDASAINEGSYIYAEYKGAEDGVYLAFSSSSGATRWVQVNADETGTTTDGRFYSIFKYDNFAKKFGTNFARLDQIQVYSNQRTAITLNRVAYFTGTGDPVDTSDGTWDRPGTGIAFIGDSIVENPKVDTAHLDGIDWNGILDRDNCDNYGIGGQDTSHLVKRIDEIAKKDYDQVVFLCGINDIGHGLTQDQIIANYRSMIDDLNEANPDVEIFIISVLPTTNAFYVGQQGTIVALNEALEALRAEYDNLSFVDVHSSFVDPDTGYCKDGLTFDGLHPNLTGYAILADILNPYLDGYRDPAYVPDDSTPDDSTPVDDSTPADDSTPTGDQPSGDTPADDSTSTPDAGNDVNPGTGAAAISTAALALLGAAAVVIKKRS